MATTKLNQDEKEIETLIEGAFLTLDGAINLTEQLFNQIMDADMSRDTLKNLQHLQKVINGWIKSVQENSDN